MRLLTPIMLLFALSFTTGCGTKSKEISGAATISADSHAGHDHSSWWCKEHGVPEEVCALCDTSLVAGFKSNGDWCVEHNRPESQCFTCDPDRFDKFATRYEAKYGEAPPAPTE